MPPVSTLTQAPDLILAIKDLGPETEKPLSWVCLSHRGFLASATRTMKITGMPAGTQQFPLLETSFPKQVNAAGGTTRVLWHGTHLTRLFAILSQGLIKSGTSLQAHGAVNGEDVPGEEWEWGRYVDCKGCEDGEG